MQKLERDLHRPGRDPRHAAQGAQAPRHPARRARRLHERGQVDAAEPAHARGRARRRTSCSRRSTPPCAGCISPAARRVLLSDTVGFVRRLPHQLVEAFRSTLEEVVDADLLLHIVDASALRRRRAHRTRSTRCCARSTPATCPACIVWNKADLADADDVEAPARRAPGLGRDLGRDRRRACPSCSTAIGDRLRALAAHLRVRRALRARRRARRAAPRRRGARRGARRSRDTRVRARLPEAAAGRFSEYASSTPD